MPPDKKLPSPPECICSGNQTPPLFGPHFHQRQRLFTRIATVVSRPKIFSSISTSNRTSRFGQRLAPILDVLDKLLIPTLEPCRTGFNTTGGSSPLASLRPLIKTKNRAVGTPAVTHFLLWSIIYQTPTRLDFRVEARVRHIQLVQLPLHRPSHRRFPCNARKTTASPAPAVQPGSFGSNSSTTCPSERNAFATDFPSAAKLPVPPKGRPA